MRNLIYRLSSATARFMYGRNGGDQLNVAILMVYLALCLLQALVAGHQTAAAAVHLLTLAVAAVVLFRMFSRNLEKRRAENERFLRWWQPIRNRLAGAHQRRMDKELKYFTCKTCKTICRVPAGKGRIEITCPKCGQKILGKS